MRIGLLSLIAICMIAPLAFAALSGPAPIPNPPNFYLKTSATTLCKGETNYIPINIMNLGSSTQTSMSAITVGLVPVKGLYEAGNGTAPANNINQGSSETVYLPVFVSSNASSLIFAGLSINYYFDTLYSDYEVRNVSFSTQSCALPLSVSLTPDILTAGNIQNITVNLTNNGAQSINDIAVRFVLPSTDGAWLSPQPLQVASLAPHTTLKVNESAYISRNASQSVALNATANYYNGSNLEQVSQNEEILASGIISMSPSSFTTSPAVPTPDSIFSVSFILTNIGTTGASAVTVTPLPPKGFSLYGTNTVFVGDIGVDTQTPVTVTMIASNSVKSGNYDVPIRVNYMNNLRQNITAWANTSISVGQLSFNSSQLKQYKTSKGSGAGAVLILIMLLVIVVLAVLLIRERRRAR